MRARIGTLATPRCRTGKRASLMPPAIADLLASVRDFVARLRNLYALLHARTASP